MKKTIVLGINFNGEQKQRLEKVSEVKYVESPETSEEFMSSVAGFDVICSDGSFLLENLPKLKNVFITYPFIELGAFDSEALKKNGVLVANTKGSSRDTIAEWVMFMILALFRQFIPLVRATKNPPFELHESLAGKKALIVGKGNIGTRIGDLCQTFGMIIDFFARGDNLTKKSKDADIIINSLNSNSTSKNLLDEKFFSSLKKGAYFVSYVRHYTFDINSLLKAIDSGVVAGAAIDSDPEEVFETTSDFYQKALSNKKILVTPHIAFSTKQASANGREFALENIEAFLAGTPKRILAKV